MDHSYPKGLSFFLGWIYQDDGIGFDAHMARGGAKYESGYVYGASMHHVVESGSVNWIEAKPASMDWHERGWWRMQPRIRFQERQQHGYDSAKNLVSNVKTPAGAIEISGQMYRLRRAKFTAAKGWTVKSRNTVRRKAEITFPNPAVGGGGISYRLARTEMDLAGAHLKPFEDYSVFMMDALDNPYSEWDVPKMSASRKARASEAFQTLKMDPILWVEVERIVLVEDGTAKEVSLEQPTGWVLGAGRFYRSVSLGK